MNRLNHSKYFWVVLLLISIVWTFLLYFRVIGFDFVNWDDNAYVYQNKDITVLSLSALYRYFTNFYLGMYQPLVMLSFAIEYYFGGLNSSVFHTTNLIFHLLNVCLVFIFVKKLTNNNFSAFIVSLFFGIHPLHVESVAWISERKDVLYSFFYLLGLISFQHYLKVHKKKFIFLTLLLFILSLLSKSSAVTFPLILVLLHFYYYKQAFNLKNTLLKLVPFFAFSLLFGLISIYSQKAFNEPDVSQQHFSQLHRIFISAYAFFMYIIHLFYPAEFSALHPLPELAGSLLPVKYYLSFFIVLCILLMVFYFIKRGFKSQFYYDMLFGFFFFTITILLILYNPSSNAVIADRYTYLPYIGLFILITGLINQMVKINTKAKIASFCLIIVLSVVYSFKAYSYIPNWQSSFILWQKTAINEPSALSYFNLAIIKAEKSDINGAIIDYQNSINCNRNYYYSYINKAVLLISKKEYQKAIAELTNARIINHHNAWIYYNLAYVYIKEKKYKTADEYLKKAMEIKPDYPEALTLKAIFSIKNSDYSLALIDLNRALDINPDYSEAHYNKGLVFSKLNKVQESIKEFTSALNVKPDYSLAYYARANAFASLNKFNEAMNDVSNCLQFDPKDYQALTLKGYLNYKSDRLKDALTDLDKAIELKPDYLLAYNNRALVNKSLSNYSIALKDLNYVIIKDPEFSNAIFNRGKIYLDLNDFDKACTDLQKAYQMGITEAGILISNNCNK